MRPIVHNHPPQYQFNSALHIHAVVPTRAGDDFTDAAENPFQR
ncbi:hypothetical protein [Streptomyces torulosus]|nr:hypothetical protein [Streptomyces torulosus]